jgi:hypothetical protein
MTNLQKKRPFDAWVLIILLFFIGISALISGAMLFLAPDGRLVQWSPKLLEGTPFTDFLIPGIILFIFIGIFPIFTCYGLLTKPEWDWPDYINPCKKFHWAWSAAWTAGVIMLIWITVETVLLGYISFLQPFIVVYGMVIIILTILPDARKYYHC